MTTQDDGRGFRLKPLSPDALTAALRRAERYRFLNEAREAESICRDVLRADPSNQEALAMLLLAISDQFSRDLPRQDEEARRLVGLLEGEFERAYYAGILAERRGKAYHLRRSPGCGAIAYDCLREAMDWYEKAEALSRAGNDDAKLRWNTCVRMIRTHADIEPAVEEREAPILLE